jgi:hypothetical protein
MFRILLVAVAIVAVAGCGRAGDPDSAQVANALVRANVGTVNATTIDKDTLANIDVGATQGTRYELVSAPTKAEVLLLTYPSESERRARVAGLDDVTSWVSRHTIRNVGTVSVVIILSDDDALRGRIANEL